MRIIIEIDGDYGAKVISPRTQEEAESVQQVTGTPMDGGSAPAFDGMEPSMTPSVLADPRSMSDDIVSAGAARSFEVGSNLDDGDVGFEFDDL